MQTVTRAHLAETIYTQVGLSRNESADLLETVLERVSAALEAGESVKISGFGTFSVRQKGRRVGRNPKTGQEVPILPRRVLVFRPSHVLKARVNGTTPESGRRRMSDPADDVAMPPVGRTRPKKAPNAFRTISEVADELHIPQHVLRFWETKFPQVKPLKRGGGRRYYRPDDIALLRRISDLLYIQGYTIKGVQRLLREGGGRLSDDIPPAPAGRTGGSRSGARRLASVEPELPMPGLAPAAASQVRSRQCTPQGRSGSRAPACGADRDVARTGGVAGPVRLSHGRLPRSTVTPLESSGPFHTLTLGKARYTRSAGTKSRYAEACVEVPPPRPRVLSANRA